MPDEVIFENYQSPHNISNFNAPRYVSLQIFARLARINELSLLAHINNGRCRTTMIDGKRYIDLETNFAKALLAQGR